MRPLIEILEDERRLMQRLESIYRYMAKDDDPEILSMLIAKKGNIEGDLAKVHTEFREYVTMIFTEDDES